MINPTDIKEGAIKEECKSIYTAKEIKEFEEEEYIKSISKLTEAQLLRLILIELRKK